MTRRAALLALLLAAASLAPPAPASTENADDPLANATREF